MLTCTIDKYVASLYDRLRDSLAIAWDCAVKEAQRQKRLYDRKVGAIELRPGDHVVVHLDAFRGQRRKLKNWWGDDLHMVVNRVADGIPAYVVKNNLDLTMYLAVIDDPEWMSSRLGCEVRAGAPRNVAGQKIVILDEDETCPECLGFYSEDVPCS